MPQRVALSQAVVGLAEGVHDGFEAMIADRRLTPEELAGYRLQLDALVEEACRADLARALAVNVGRCGPTGEHFGDLVHAWDEFAARPVVPVESELVAVVVAGTDEMTPHAA